MIRLGFCHDQVSLSQVMDLYYFVYGFVIFSLFDGMMMFLVISNDFK